METQYLYQLYSNLYICNCYKACKELVFAELMFIHLVCHIDYTQILVYMIKYALKIGVKAVSLWSFFHSRNHIALQFQPARISRSTLYQGYLTGLQYLQSPWHGRIRIRTFG